jgi:hypothetical protein
MAKKCARTFSIVVEKGKKSILDVGHLLPGGIARSVRPQKLHEVMSLSRLVSRLTPLRSCPLPNFA